MKVMALGLLAGALVATSANAAFVGINVVEVDLVAEYTAAGYTPAATDTDLSTVTAYHLIAQFDAPEMILGIGPATATTDTAFVDYDGTGAATEGIPSNSGGFIGIIGEIIVDSFWTINELQDPGGASSGVGGVPFPDFMDGSNSYANTEAGYGVTPVSGIGDAVNNGGVWEVLIAQIIVEGEGLVEGSVQFSTSGATIDADYAVPAPGALALLGLAGLASRRRRR
jgi:MYXO-CTERM domain-containing protein